MVKKFSEVRTGTVGGGGVADHGVSFPFVITLGYINDGENFETMKGHIIRCGKNFHNSSINLSRLWLSFPTTEVNINHLRVLVKSGEVSLTPETIAKLKTLTQPGATANLTSSHADVRFSANQNVSFRDSEKLSTKKVVVNDGRESGFDESDKSIHTVNDNTKFGSYPSGQISSSKNEETSGAVLKVAVNPFKELNVNVVKEENLTFGLGYLRNGVVFFGSDGGVAEEMRKHPSVRFKDKKYNIPPGSVYDVALWCARKGYPISEKLFLNITKPGLSKLAEVSKLQITSSHSASFTNSSNFLGSSTFPLSSLKEVPLDVLVSMTPQRVKKFNSFNIETLYDLIYTLPRRYVDRTLSSPIRGLTEGSDVGVIGTVVAVEPNHARRFLKIKISDTTGSLPLTFFNSMWMAKKFTKGDEVLVYGKPERWKPGSPLSMTNPLIEHYEETSLPVVPIYPQSGKNGVTSVEIRRAMREVVPILDSIHDPLSQMPQQLKDRMPRLASGDALKMIHFPSEMKDVYIAKHKLAFDELLGIQVAFLRSKISLHKERGHRHTNFSLTDAYLAGLPYTPTRAQEEAVGEIKADVSSSHPMHRLLQGDVGAGKAQPLTSKVATTDGWKNMGDIEIGEELINPESFTGEKSFVTGIFPQGSRRVTMVYFSDGSVVSCDNDHLWEVYVKTVNDCRKIHTTGENFRRQVITTQAAHARLRKGECLYVREPDQKAYKVLNSEKFHANTANVNDNGHPRRKRSRCRTATQVNWEGVVNFTLPYVGKKMNVSVLKKFFRTMKKATAETCELFILDTHARLHQSGFATMYVQQEIGGVVCEWHMRSCEVLKDEIVELLHATGCRDINTAHRSTLDGCDVITFTPPARLHAHLTNSQNDETVGKLHMNNVAVETDGGDIFVKQIVNIEESEQLTEMRCLKVSQQNGLYITDGCTVTHNTTVAVATLLMGVGSGNQVALMAPTEILATQLYHDVVEACDQHNKTRGGPLRVEFFSNQLKGKKREETLEALRLGDIHIAVGTHALLSDDVKFHNLSLIVIDEQHRFGVEQRNALREKSFKNITPDTLVMTATPIPRTAIMTVFGDLDLSVLNEMPPGRTPIETVWYDEEPDLVNRDAEPWKVVQREIAKGHQVFVVCPLVEESETLEVVSATETYEGLKFGSLSGFKIGLVHGQQKPKEREETMEMFKNGELDVLVSTTVVEVGVNVPNATVMVILDPNRFGISQLHQLRGRVGRGQHKSFCLLYGVGKTPDSRERLTALTETNDGFKLSEKDLHIRGHGSIFGSQQSGVSDLKVADIREHAAIVEEVKTLSREMLNYTASKNVRNLFDMSEIDNDTLKWLSKS